MVRSWLIRRFNRCARGSRLYRAFPFGFALFPNAFLLPLLLAACTQAPASAPPTPSAAESAAGPLASPTAPPAAMLPLTSAPAALAALPTAPTPPLRSTPPPSPTPTPWALPSAAPWPTASPELAEGATRDPYAPYTIAALAARDYGDGQLQIIERLESNDVFAKYLITYPSDGLTIYGFMNVPHEGSRFPVAIVLHGYIDPQAYETLAYTTRYADALAEAGYFAIHPNLRGFPPSDDGDDTFRTGLAIDVLNLIAIIRQQSQDPEGPLRRADAEAIHLWGHSMGGGAALRVATVLNEPYLRAAVLYGAMSGDESLNYERIQEWSGGRSGSFELAAPPQALEAISPIYHLQRIRAPLSIHHGDADETVPPEWSADLCQRLEVLRHPVECFSYNAAPHTFYGDWEELFNRRVIDFFGRH